MRRAVGVAALLAATVLSGCSGDPEPATSDSVADPAADPATEVAPAWNPCSGLDTAVVAREFGTVFDTRLGTADAPLCTFTPQEEGGPAIDINYQTYPGTLEELLDTFGILEEAGRTTVTAIDVPGADDARLIVDVADDDTIAITAFVRTGLLVQIVNTLDPAPFDRAALTADVKTVAADLAANAGTSGLTGS